MDSLCFAESYYYVESKTTRIENVCQPIALNDKLMEATHTDSQFAKIIPLMSSKEKLKQRKVKAVCDNTNPMLISMLKSMQNMFFSFYSFRNEYHLKSPPYCGTYLAKIQEAGVTEIINPNRQVMQPYSTLVNEALINLSETLIIIMTHFLTKKMMKLRKSFIIWQVMFWKNMIKLVSLRE